MRKYNSYAIAYSDRDAEVFYNYRQAFSAYRQTMCSATLYGVNNMGEYSVIMSK